MKIRLICVICVQISAIYIFLLTISKTMTKELLTVFIGGGVGSVSRYAIALALGKFQWLLHGFPLHTFVINVSGSFLIGLLMGYLSKNPAQWIYFLLVVGFCGGFTTFSAFALEIVQLFKAQHVGVAFLYIVLSVLCCVAATFGAMRLTA